MVSLISFCQIFIPISGKVPIFDYYFWIGLVQPAPPTRQLKTFPQLEAEDSQAAQDGALAKKQPGRSGPRWAMEKGPRKVGDVGDMLGTENYLSLYGKGNYNKLL